MTPKLLKLTASRIAATVIAVGVLFLFAACWPKSENSKPVYTGTTVTQSEMITQLGHYPFTDKYSSLVYEVVDYDWLIKSYHDIFWNRMFAEGITKWDPRANCAVFTEEYVGGLQRAYYRDHFQSSGTALRMAVGEMWYIPDAARPDLGHAVVVAVTNRGVVYLEPQSRAAPRVLSLTTAQLDSRYLRKF